MLLAAAIFSCASIAVSAVPTRHAARHNRRSSRHEPLVQQRSMAAFGDLAPTERHGVPGNLPFNNQLRKFSDPLGANGR